MKVSTKVDRHNKHGAQVSTKVDKAKQSNI